MVVQKLANAFVSGGNEPWAVNGGGNSSLTIGPGGSASGPKVCAALNAPGWRMFAHSKGANGPLQAQVIFYGLLVSFIFDLTNTGLHGVPNGGVNAAAVARGTLQLGHLFANWTGSGGIAPTAAGRSAIFSSAMKSAIR